MYQKSKIAAKVPEVLYLRNYDIHHQDVFDHGNSQEAYVYIGVSKDDRQLKMAAGTGNTYISEAKKGTVKILTTNLWFKTL